MLSGVTWILQLPHEAIENEGHEKVNCDVLPVESSLLGNSDFATPFSVLFSCNVEINALILKLYGYSFLKMVPRY